MIPLPRKHHYIPEFYSKWWAGPSGQLECWVRPTPTKIIVRRAYPSEVGWVRNLYWSPEEDAREAQRIELMLFQRLDHDAAISLRKLNEPVVDYLDSKDTSAWSTFIMSLFHRTPDNLAGFKTHGRLVMRNILPSLKQQLKGGKGPGKHKSMDEYEANLNDAELERVVLRCLLSLVYSKNVGQFFTDMHWTHIDLPPRRAQASFVGRRRC